VQMQIQSSAPLILAGTHSRDAWMPRLDCVLRPLRPLRLLRDEGFGIPPNGAGSRDGLVAVDDADSAVLTTGRT
jgi:hypothetical protein